MANTQSAKKAIRSTKKKRKNNLFWKKRIKKASKNLQNLLDEGANTDILERNLNGLQKIVDKAAKNKVIHKNKANRIKSRFANKISAYGKDKNNKQNKKTKSKSSK